jgi:DNA-binding CsgD family transcriptional regulator
MDADGHFTHAEGAAAGKTARERLRAAAKAIETSRMRGRKSGRDALDLWHPLVGARWTLVNTFEENGRRYVLARENQAQVPHFHLLADRERQVVLQAVLGFTNKEIAYSLGISNSTVRVLMARAAKKIGVRTRKELMSHPTLSAIRGQGDATEPTDD